MKRFFGNDLFLESKSAKKIYKEIKDLPIIDYHCHLDEKAIAEDRKFSSIGELWLAGDHYKWRAMRLCGVEEEYITGEKSYREKFQKYAEIMPKLMGNPLYYWTHMELRRIFGINLPLNGENAGIIWEKANEKLKELSVRSLLKMFRVEYVATTDDPMKELDYHGIWEGVEVRPTFRPDNCFKNKTEKSVLEERLDYFTSKGCVIADHGFDFADKNNEDLKWLIEACFKRNLVLQLHFGTFRNINGKMFEKCGPDSGFDVFRSEIDTDGIACVLNEMNNKLGGLPKIILYPLNDTYLKSLCAISGAFPNVTVGAAWWFNDTAEGIKRQLTTVAEYAVLGTQVGMLTDSRSFSSYVRFDFYRRLLAEYMGEKAEKGECDMKTALQTAKDIAYNNVRQMIRGQR